MDRTYLEHANTFSNEQDEGGITPPDVQGIVDSTRTSYAIESYNSATGVAFNRDTADWNYRTPTGEWDDKTETSPADWFFLRSKLIASTAVGYRNVGGYLRPTVDGAGLKYTGGLQPRMFLVNWIINGNTSHSMYGGIGLYRGASWPGSSVRQDITVFDTGITDTDGVFPFILKDTSVVLMMPGDELRFRFEYFGASIQKRIQYTLSGGSLTETEISAEDDNPTAFIARINQFALSMANLGPVEGMDDNWSQGGTNFPAVVGDHYSSRFSMAQSLANGIVNMDLV